MFAIFALLISCVQAAEDVYILQPLDLAAQYPDGLQHRPALFGVPSYAASIQGPLIYATPGDRDGCSPLNNTDWPVGVRIVMVDRGDCTFVTKVRHVQDAGGSAAIIVDNVAETFLPYMADDGTGSDIFVPSVLITLADGAVLKSYVQDPNAIGSVLVSMSWTMPHPDGRVEWQLWTSSNDPQAREFKTIFGPVAAAIGPASYFEPHYFILPGAVYGCTQASRPCGNQCTDDGRYCATDPDGSISDGISGLDVVQENLRQMCLFRHLNDTGRGQLWWDYVSQFITDCCQPADFLTGPCTSTAWSAQCSYNVMTSLNIASSVIQTCEANDMTTLFDAEIFLRDMSGIFFLPTLTINQAAFRGTLICNDPLNAHTCGPLEAICAGYESGTSPAACGGDISCSFGVYQDECGVCGNDGVVDQCGLCLSPSSPNFDMSCAGCDGVPNSGKVNDACGICDGTGSFDQCGRCWQAGDPNRVDDPTKECNAPVVIDNGTSLAFKDNVMLYSIFIIVLILLFVGVFFYTKRQRDHLARIDNVLQSYLPLEQANENRRGGPANRRGGTSINDADGDLNVI